MLVVAFGGCSPKSRDGLYKDSHQVTRGAIRLCEMRLGYGPCMRRHVQYLTNIGGSWSGLSDSVSQGDSWVLVNADSLHLKRAPVRSSGQSSGIYGPKPSSGYDPNRSNQLHFLIFDLNSRPFLHLRAHEVSVMEIRVDQQQRARFCSFSHGILLAGGLPRQAQCTPSNVWHCLWEG